MYVVRRAHSWLRCGAIKGWKRPARCRLSDASGPGGGQGVLVVPGVGVAKRRLGRPLDDAALLRGLPVTGCGMCVPLGGCSGSTPRQSMGGCVMRARQRLTVADVLDLMMNGQNEWQDAG